MKKLFLMYLFFCVLISAQNIEVLETIEITTLEDGEYAHPIFNNDTQHIVFTTPNYTGLYLYNKSSKKIEQLNDYLSAGYKPSFSEDGSKIFFRKDIFKGIKKYSSIVSQNIFDKKETILLKENRIVSPPIVQFNKLFFTHQENVSSINIADKSLVKSLSTAIVQVENQKIVLYENEQKKVLEPIEEGIYLWVSISPDNKSILFTAAGKGTYICDLEGNILSELGEANAPQWSNDGKWIVYMLDEDDHRKVIASDLFAITSDGKIKIQLTNTKNIFEMYPKWSPKGDEIVFNTADGKICLMKVKVN